MQTGNPGITWGPATQRYLGMDRPFSSYVTHYTYEADQHCRFHAEERFGYEALNDGWLEAGTTVYVRPGDLQKDSRPPFWEPGDPAPKWTIYDAQGMAHKVDFFEARDALEAL